MTITQTYLPTLEELQSLFGGSVGKTGGYGPQLGKKQCYNWSLSGHGSYAFIMAVMPYLKEKREHAMFCAEAWENRDDTELFIERVAERKRRWGRAAAETK